MQVERLVVGPMEVNCYLVIDETIQEAIIIDPGAEADRILEIVEAKELTVKYVVNTHGHVDHISANQQVLAATSADLLIHKQDADFLTEPELNLSTHLGREKVTSPLPDRLLQEGEVIEVGNVSLEVIHTPGHTPGGICLQGTEVLITGDTLFAMGIGRTDFPQSSTDQLQDSLDKLMELTDDYKVYPGHGPTSTLTKVKKKNMYL